MDNFKSWKSYRDFSLKLCRDNRYVWNTDIEQFLETVLITCKSRERDINKDTVLWRAQLGHDWEPIYEAGEYIDDMPSPFSPDRMKPLNDRSPEGRVNPKGIPYLYLADNKETAMSEVRPWIGSIISIGQFKVLKDILIVDCSLDHQGFVFHFKEPDDNKKNKAVWSDIGSHFSTPVSPSDETADYVPSQVLAELFKNNGYDGVAYHSSLGSGMNIALFNVDLAKLVNCSIYKVKSLSYNFDESGNPYFIKECDASHPT